MINLLLLLFFLACLGITAAWLAENPGNVTIYWFDWRIDTSFAFLLVMAILSAVVLAYSWILVRRLILLPVHFSEKRTLKHYSKGLTELTYGVAALAASDTAEARLHTRKAEKLLGRTPLTLLLSAQIARSNNDDAQTRLLLEQMLEHKETEYLAARYLSEAAGKQGQFPRALALAQRAHGINPMNVESIVGLHIRLGQWQEAMLAIAKATRKGKISRAELRRYKGLVYLQQGLQLLAENNPQAACLAARHAVKQLPDFAPALLFAVKAYAANGEKRKSEKWLKKLAELHPRVNASQPLWACSACGHASAQWHAHCLHCDAFDTVE